VHIRDTLGVVHKRSMQSGWVVQCGHFSGKGGGGGGPKADVPTFWAKKNFKIFKFIVHCPHGQGVLSQRGYFTEKGGTSFSDFVRTSFMDGP